MDKVFTYDTFNSSEQNYRKVGTTHCIVLISKKEARKLIIVVAQTEI